MGEGCYNFKYGSQRCFPKKVHLSKTSRRGRRCGDLREELSMQSEQQVQRPWGRSVPGIFNCGIASRWGQSGERQGKMVKDEVREGRGYRQSPGKALSTYSCNNLGGKNEKFGEPVCNPFSWVEHQPCSARARTLYTDWALGACSTSVPCHCIQHLCLDSSKLNLCFLGK